MAIEVTCSIEYDRADSRFATSLSLAGCKPRISPDTITIITLLDLYKGATSAVYSRQYKHVSVNDLFCYGFIMFIIRADSCGSFTYILQGYFTGTWAIIAPVSMK